LLGHTQAMEGELTALRSRIESERTAGETLREEERQQWALEAEGCRRGLERDLDASQKVILTPFQRHSNADSHHSNAIPTLIHAIRTPF
jgi:hypothetical protein